MARRTFVTWPFSAVICAMLCAVSATLLAQTPSRPAQVPLAAGQRIDAHDGDVVVVRNDARVAIVRRHDAIVRAIFNPTQHWLLLLVDYAAPTAPDGVVDMTYFTIGGVDGEWPLEERWEGASVVEDYSNAGDTVWSGVGMTTPRGLVQVFSATATAPLRDPNAVAVLSTRILGRSAGNRLPFDEAEKAIRKNILSTAVGDAETQRGTPGTSRSFGASGAPSVSAGGTSFSGGMAPVRVGGNIAQPKKIVEVAPVMPDQARAAGVRGVVILEIVVGPDGSVTDAHVLRSIPLLDQAAIDTVRQWRYEATLLNGQAVPVIMTVTVAFY